MTVAFKSSLPRALISFTFHHSILRSTARHKLVPFLTSEIHGLREESPSIF